MITINEIGCAVYGAYRLARRDPGGMAFFDRSRIGALKSFYAAVILLPFAVFFVIITWSEKMDLGLISPQRVLIFESLNYVIAWTIFPVMMIGIARWIDRSDRYFDYLVASNWASVVAMAVRFPGVLFKESEILPEALMTVFVFALIAVLVIYQWFVMKTSLKISSGMASSLTAAEFFLTMMVGNAIDTIIAVGI